MAGQRPTAVAECIKPPTIVLTVPFSLPYTDDPLTTAADLIPAVVTEIPLFIAPFNLVIEQITLRYENGSDTATAKLMMAPSGTALSSGTQISTTTGLSYNDSAGTTYFAKFRTSRGATVQDDNSIGPSENIVPAGYMVGVILSEAISGFGTISHTYTVRCSGVVK